MVHHCMMPPPPPPAVGAGIIYVSDTDLDWSPVVEGWLLSLPDTQAAEFLRNFVARYLGEPSSAAAAGGGGGGGAGGDVFRFLTRNVTQVLKTTRVGLAENLLALRVGVWAEWPRRGRGAVIRAHPITSHHILPSCTVSSLCRAPFALLCCLCFAAAATAAAAASVGSADDE